MIWGTLELFRDGSGDTQLGPGRIKGLSRRSGKGRGTHGQVLDGLGDPPECLGRFVGPLGRFGTGRRTFGEVWDG